MVRLVAWGNNAAGNLGADDSKVLLHEPTVLRKGDDIEEIEWASWTCAIAKKDDGTYTAWGKTGLDDEPMVLRLLEDVPHTKIIGHEQPVAILTTEGEVRSFTPDKPTRKGIKDLAITGLGIVYALTNCGLSRFQSFDKFLDNTNAFEVNHPAFDFSHQTTLHATESRVMLLEQGSLPHLFELTTDGKGVAQVNLVEDLEGLGIISVIAGSANRFAVLTEAGDAYLLAKGTLEPELLESEDETPVRLMGLGSNFEMLVTDCNVWYRGANNFSQLGLGEGHGANEDGFSKHPFFDRPDCIGSLHCGRWSTIAVMRDAAA